ncbi:hypothetical protein F511_15860 [Dorcoceras hygrometricum]|uniref:Uncharacterized protein n=1 Tax=Dorcoceras hygrometricum TaxID=472368 RepID=A0A2Z7D0W5_9LAMI|nr:hypothetical protein F511_15860 [Dorcoceras hygrometricum]
MESAVMTSTLMSSQSAVVYQQMRREVKEMKRRRARESADGLALMTSLVTSSQSADGLSLAVARTSKCYLEIAIAKRCRLHKLIRQRFALALKKADALCDEENQQSLGNPVASYRIQSQESRCSEAWQTDARYPVVVMNQQRSS